MAATNQDRPSVFDFKTKLCGHSGRIYCLAAKDNLLACGAYSGTTIWDLKTMRQVPIVSGSASIIGPTTTLLWLPCDKKDNWLVYGTANGRLVVMKQESRRDQMIFTEAGMTQLVGNHQVTAIAYDEGSRKMAVATRNQGLYVFKIEEHDGNLRRECLYAVEVPGQFAAALAFLPSATGRELHSFGQNGTILTLDVNGNVIKERPTSSFIGGLSVLEDRIAAIDDPMFGVVLYRIDGWSTIGSYAVHRKRRTGRPRNVAFVGNDWVAIGSDHGKLYILDRKSGEIVEELRIDRTEWVQVVETATVGSSKFLIMAHSGNSNDDNAIFIFEERREVVNRTAASPQPNDPAAVGIAYLVALICIAMLVWQNYGGKVTERLFSPSEIEI